MVFLSGALAALLLSSFRQTVSIKKSLRCWLLIVTVCYISFPLNFIVTVVSVEDVQCFFVFFAHYIHYTCYSSFRQIASIKNL